MAQIFFLPDSEQYGSRCTAEANPCRRTLFASGKLAMPPSLGSEYSIQDVSEGDIESFFPVFSTKQGKPALAFP